MEGQRELSVVETSSDEVGGEQTNIDAEKGTDAKEAAYSTGLQNDLPRSPSSSAAVDVSKLEVRSSSEATLSTDEAEAVFTGGSLANGTEFVMTPEGTVVDGGAGSKGGSIRGDGSSATSAIDFRASPSTRKSGSALQGLTTECSVAPAVTPAAYLTLMTGMLMSQVRTGRLVSGSVEGDAVVARPRYEGVQGSLPVCEVASKENALVDVKSYSSSDPGFPNLVGHAVPGCESVPALATAQSSSDGLDMVSGSNSTSKKTTSGERHNLSSSTSGLDLDDFWQGGGDAGYSTGPAPSGDNQQSPSTASRDRSTANNAAGAQSKVLAGINEPLAPHKLAYTGKPTGLIALWGSGCNLHSNTQHSASGRDHDLSAACAGQASAASGLSETTPTAKEDSALSLESGRAEWERAGGRDGDGVALAAASGDAGLTASSPSFSTNAPPEDRCQATLSYTDGGSAILDATIREPAAVHDPTPSIDCTQEVASSRTLSSSAHVAAQPTAAISSRRGEASRGSEANLVASGATVAVAPATGRASSSRRIRSKGVRSSTRKGSSRGNCTSEDIIHAMCMICLENLSDTTKGGGQKMLGLIDSCSHRYCYNCILEWSKVTNRCPQCKVRFHTIKAVKELRQSSSRYRGVAVSVEDRDQKYSFVDVRDVVVLDPEVRCHSSCLLLGAVDALQEQGWEFSVQCEHCSEWFHGLCVGFREESAVPDLWFCRFCRGLAHQTVGNPDSTTTGSNTSGAHRGASSGRVRSRSRRAQGSGQLPPPVPVQGQEAHKASNGGAEDQIRNASGLRREASAPIEATRSASPRLTRSSTASAPSLERASSTSSAPLEATVTISRERGRSRSGRRSSSASPPSSQAPLTVAPPRRSRGRRRMSETPPVSATQAESPAAQDSTNASIAIAPPAQGRSSPRLSQSPVAQVAPTRERERAHLSQSPAESIRTALRSASPAAVPPRGCDSPLLSLTLSSSRPRLLVAGTSVSTQLTPVTSLSAVPAQALPKLMTAPLVVTTPTVSSRVVPAPAVSASVVSAQSGPLPAVQSPAVPDPIASTFAVRAPGLPVPAISMPAISAPVMPALTVPSTTVPAPDVTMPEAAMPDMSISAPAIPAPGVLAQALPTTAVEVPAVPPFAQGGGTPRFSEISPRAPGSDKLVPSESPSPVPQQNHLADADVRRKGKGAINKGNGSGSDRGTQKFVEEGESGGFSSKTAARPALPEAPVLPFLQSLEAPQATDLCDICGFDTERDNLIVYCGACNMGVHQTCYGISKIPSKEWLCSPCSTGVHPSTLACRFCPVKGGALKRCTDGSWGHILCAFWIPECCFLDPDEMEPIGSMNKRGETGEVEKFLPTFRSRKCYICGTTKGCVIRCHTNSCKFHFHPMCGSKAGSVYMEIETTMKIGPDGQEYESVTLVARCPRHDKRKAGTNRDRRSRGYASRADPLGLVGRTLEITEPERDDGKVLKGKITWFNPEQSMYCLAESWGDNNAGSGDTAENFVHWIARDKLVEVKAVCIETRRRERFVVEMPPAIGDYCERQEQAKTDTAADIENRRVKTEEGMAGTEKRDGALLADKNYTERGEEQRNRDFGEHPILENTEPHEGNSRSRTGGKRLRGDSLSKSESLDASRSKRVALEVQTLTMVTPSWCHSEVTKQEPPYASQSSRSGDFDIQSTLQETPASEGGASSTLATQDGEEAVAIAAGQQPKSRGRLPAVQVHIEPGDSWGGYSTRGRQRQQPIHASRHSDSGIQGSMLPMSLRMVKQEDVNEVHSSDCCSLTSRNATGMDPRVAKGTVPPANAVAPESSALFLSSQKPQEKASMEVQSKRVETDANSSLGPVDMIPRVAKNTAAPASALAPESSVLLSSGQIPQEEASTTVQSKRDETGATSPIGPATAPKNDLGHKKRPGWPYGIALPGNIPIMRVHTVSVASGRETKYFASDYYNGQSVEYDQKSMMRLSFRFEDLDEIRVLRAREQTQTSWERNANSNGRPHCNENMNVESKTQQAGRAIQLESNIGHDSNPPNDGDIHAEEQPKMEGKIDNSEGAGEGAAVDDSAPSSPSPDDISEMEDGEIETLPDGRPNITPPSPRDNMESGAKMLSESEKGKTSTAAQEGMEEAAHREGVPQDMPANGKPVNGHQADCTDDDAEEEGSNSEDMEISSDDMSMDEAEREETVSSVSSDEQIVQEGDGDVANDCSDRGKTREWESTQDNTAGASADFSLPEGPGSTCTQPMDKEETAPPDEQGTVTLDEQPTAMLGDSTGVASPTSKVEEHEGNAESAVRAFGEELERSHPSDPLREIVRQNLEIRLSAGKGEGAMVEGTNAADVYKRIAFDVENELFRRLYRDETEGHEYKAKYKQLMLSLGNTRNHRLVDSVMARTTTPVDLATKDAVGLLKSLNSSLNCEAVPLTGRNGQSSPGVRGQMRKSNRRGKMVLLG